VQGERWFGAGKNKKVTKKARGKLMPFRIKRKHPEKATENERNRKKAKSEVGTTGVKAKEKGLKIKGIRKWRRK